MATNRGATDSTCIGNYGTSVSTGNSHVPKRRGIVVGVGKAYPTCRFDERQLAKLVADELANAIKAALLRRLARTGTFLSAVVVIVITGQALQLSSRQDKSDTLLQSTGSSNLERQGRAPSVRLVDSKSAQLRYFPRLLSSLGSVPRSAVWSVGIVPCSEL